MKEPTIEEKEKIVELTKLFESYGADSPELWARSEVMEDIAQLARFLFLHAAWKNVVLEDSTTWMDEEIQYSMRQPNGPCASIGYALKRLLELGASRDDITDIVRGMQYRTLFGICYLIDDPKADIPEIGEFGWVLHEINKNGEITGRIVQGLHESALSMDPTGREMRQKISKSK